MFLEIFLKAADTKKKKKAGKPFKVAQQKALQVNRTKMIMALM